MPTTPSVKIRIAPSVAGAVAWIIQARDLSRLACCYAQQLDAPEVAAYLERNQGERRRQLMRIRPTPGLVDHAERLGVPVGDLLTAGVHRAAAKEGEARNVAAWLGRSLVGFLVSGEERSLLNLPPDGSPPMLADAGLLLVSARLIQAIQAAYPGADWDTAALGILRRWAGTQRLEDTAR